MEGEVESGSVEIVRRVFDAFTRRDRDVLLEIMDPEIEFYAPTAAIANEGRCYRGHEGIGRYLRDVDTLWARLEVLPERFRVVGHHVVALGRVKAQARDGLEIDSPVAWVWQIRAGKVVWGCVYADPAESFMGLALRDEEPAGRPQPGWTDSPAQPA